MQDSLGGVNGLVIDVLNAGRKLQQQSVSCLLDTLHAYH